MPHFFFLAIQLSHLTTARDRGSPSPKRWTHTAVTTSNRDHGYCEGRLTLPKGFKSLRTLLALVGLKHQTMRRSWKFVRGAKPESLDTEPLDPHSVGLTYMDLLWDDYNIKPMQLAVPAHLSDPMRTGTLRCHG